MIVHKASSAPRGGHCAGAQGRCSAAAGAHTAARWRKSPGREGDHRAAGLGAEVAQGVLELAANGS